MTNFRILAATDIAGGHLPHFMLGGYMLLLVWLCYLGYRKGKATEEDYYLAGRGQGTIVTSLTVMATFFSSCLLYTSPSPRDATLSRMPSSA